jgi:hypothetical protein
VSFCELHWRVAARRPIASAPLVPKRASAWPCSLCSGETATYASVQFGWPLPKRLRLGLVAKRGGVASGSRAARVSACVRLRGLGVLSPKPPSGERGLAPPSPSPRSPSTAKGGPGQGTAKPSACGASPALWPGDASLMRVESAVSSSLPWAIGAGPGVGRKPDAVQGLPAARGPLAPPPERSDLGRGRPPASAGRREDGREGAAICYWRRALGRYNLANRTWHIRFARKLERRWRLGEARVAVFDRSAKVSCCVFHAGWIPHNRQCASGWSTDRQAPRTSGRPQARWR